MRPVVPLSPRLLSRRREQQQPQGQQQGQRGAAPRSPSSPRAHEVAERLLTSKSAAALAAASALIESAALSVQLQPAPSRQPAAAKALVAAAAAAGSELPRASPQSTVDTAAFNTPSGSPSKTQTMKTPRASPGFDSAGGAGEEEDDADDADDEVSTVASRHSEDGLRSPGGNAVLEIIENARRRSNVKNKGKGKKDAVDE